MENSPLNNAHYYARKAESFLKLNEISDSLANLEKCINCLSESLNLTTSPKAIESIKLQRQHHIRQRDLILHHYEKYKKNEKQKQDSANFQLNDRVINSNKIQLDLFENIDSTDTLLEELKKSNPESQTASELQQVNSQLNVLLYQLITHLDETIQENDMLKEKIKSLEADVRSRTTEKRSELQAMDDLAPDDLGLSEAIEVHEEFAPLELPEFDLGTLETPRH